jgi:hypothetical protein
MKKLAISYVELSMCLEDKSRELSEYYLDVQTGDIIKTDCGIMQQWEEGEEITVEDFPDLPPEAFSEMLAVFSDTDKNRYFVVPKIWPENEKDIMNKFILKINDVNLSEKLVKLIYRPRALELFKDKLEPYPEILQNYYRFEENIYRDILVDWLYDIGIKPEWI